MSENQPHSVVTPGNHDGVHLGHRALIDAARELAAPNGWQTMALCFNPHPTEILAPERAPVLITDMERRVELLKGAGCDDVAVFPFDEAFAQTAPKVFVEDILMAECSARAVVVGPDFHFGHKRSGNVETLRELGDKHGFSVHVVEPVMLDGEAVSSTRIRRLLREDGAVADVATMLTRVHEIVGRVVQGDQRGRAIGFPTANLDVPPLQLPSHGVYSVVAKAIDSDDAPLLRGVANLGVRPTFEAGPSVEVHLFDFDGDLYGERLRVGFVKRVRGERKFDGVDALTAQIALDCDAAKAQLDKVDPELLRWM